MLTTTTTTSISAAYRRFPVIKLKYPHEPPIHFFLAFFLVDSELTPSFSAHSEQYQVPSGDAVRLTHSKWNCEGGERRQ